MIKPFMIAGRKGYKEYFVMLKKGWAANMTGLNMVLVLCVCVAMPVCAQVSKTAKKSPQANEANNQVKAAGIFEEGQNAHQAGDLNKAIDLYSQALKLDPMLWQAEFQKGNAYLSLKKYDEAKRSMLGARELLSQFADSGCGRTFDGCYRHFNERHSNTLAERSENRLPRESLRRKENDGSSRLIPASAVPPASAITK